MKMHSVTEENAFQEIFDFSLQEPLGIDAEFDKLNLQQRIKLNEALKQIRQENARTAAERSKEWFQEAVIPVLKDFAEITESVMTVKQMEGSIYEIILKNPYGYDITEDSRSLRIMMGLAVHIGIEMRNGEVILALTYDCSKSLR